MSPRRTKPPRGHALLKPRRRLISSTPRISSAVMSVVFLPPARQLSRGLACPTPRIPTI